MTAPVVCTMQTWSSPGLRVRLRNRLGSDGQWEFTGPALVIPGSVAYACGCAQGCAQPGRPGARVAATAPARSRTSSLVKALFTCVFTPRHGDAEALGDLCVAQHLGDQAQHLNFARLLGVPAP